MYTFYKTIYKFLLVAFFLLQGTVNAKEIALTFDDSPRNAFGYFDGPNGVQKLIDELKQHRIKQVAIQNDLMIRLKLS